MNVLKWLGLRNEQNPKPTAADGELVAGALGRCSFCSAPAAGWTYATSDRGGVRRINAIAACELHRATHSEVAERTAV